MRSLERSVMTNGHPRLVHSPAGGKWGSMVEIADDPELDRVLAELDPDAAVAKQSCDQRCNGSASVLPAKDVPTPFGCTNTTHVRRCTHVQQRILKMYQMSLGVPLYVQYTLVHT